MENNTSRHYTRKVGIKSGLEHASKQLLEGSLLVGRGCGRRQGRVGGGGGRGDRGPSWGGSGYHDLALEYRSLVAAQRI